MEDPSDDDLLVEDLLDEALADYEDLLPPDALRALRDSLGDTLAATASGRRLLRQIKPDPELQRSGDVTAAGAEPDAAAASEDAGRKASG